MISEFHSHGSDTFFLLEAAIARSNTVALDFGWALFGRAGGILFSLIVVIACLGTITGAHILRRISICHPLLPRPYSTSFLTASPLWKTPFILTHG